MLQSPSSLDDECDEFNYVSKERLRLEVTFSFIFSMRHGLTCFAFFYPKFDHKFEYSEVAIILFLFNFGFFFSLGYFIFM